MNSIEKRAAEQMVRNHALKNPVTKEPEPELSPEIQEAIDHVHAAIEHLATIGGADLEYTVGRRYLYNQHGTLDVPEFIAHYSHDGPTMRSIEERKAAKERQRAEAIDQLIRDIWADRVDFRTVERRMQEELK